LSQGPSGPLLPFFWKGLRLGRLLFMIKGFRFAPMNAKNAPLTVRTARRGSPIETSSAMAALEKARQTPLDFPSRHMGGD